MRELHDGSILAGYRLERLLGRGGMGEVWLARDDQLDRPVALKLIVGALSHDPDFRQRFLRETRLAAALDHPHIVPVYEAGEFDGELYLAMRYVEGSDLHAVVATGGPLEPGRAVGLLRGVADALDAAHARGLVHRDVKPSNILVAPTPSGEHSYLTDFGLTKQLGSEMTASDKVVGSIGYIAPEQIEGRPAERRSDVYSLGCALYAALVGRSPFERETEAATLYAQLRADPPLFAETRPAVSALDPVMGRALAKDPATRPASAGDFFREVATALGIGAAAWTTTAGKADIELPYVGLRAFDETDSRFYFGREPEVDALLGHIRGDRFLAVFGPSGSGKSSLVRAGLVPALRAGGLPGSARWPVHVIRPGARPLETLSAELVRLRPSAPMGGTIDELARDSRTIHLASAMALAGDTGAERSVWIIDQAEELFTLCHDEDARQAAMANLVYAAHVPDGPVIVILAMRADFYQRCAAYPDLAAAVAGAQFLVTPMNLDGLRRAIIEPASLVGLEFEPGLVDTILDDVAARPGSLPLLEHALFELWDRRRGATLTLAGYRESGGVDGAIAVRAESVYNALGGADQAIARRILLRLTQLGEGTEDTRRRATYRELGARPSDDDPVDRVVEELVGARLLTLAAAVGTDEPIVDIAHEALLRAWPRIRTWVDEDRADLTIQRWLADAAAQWERLDHDDDGLFRGARLAQATEFRDRREELLNELEVAFVDASVARARREVAATERRRRLTVVGAFALAAFFLGLSALVGGLWIQSEGARRDAIAARDAANAANASVETQRNEAVRQRQIAQSRGLAAASQTQLDADLDLSLLLAVEAVDHEPSPEAQNSLLTALASRPQVTRFLHGETSGVRFVGVSSDGKVVVAAATDARVMSWDPSTGQRLVSVLATGANEIELGQVSFTLSPDGRKAVAVGPDWVEVWDLLSGAHAIQARPGGGPHGGFSDLAWEVDGRHLDWQSSDDSTLVRWDTSTGHGVSSELPAGLSGDTSLSPDGRTLVVRQENGDGFRFFDIASGKWLRGSMSGDTPGFSPNGKFVAVANSIGDVQVRSLPALEIVGSARMGSRPTALVVSPDGHRVVATPVDGRLGVWRVAGPNGSLEGGSGELPDLSAPGTVGSLAWSADGRTIVAGMQDGTVVVIDVNRDQRLLIDHVSSIRADDGRWLRADLSDGAGVGAVCDFNGKVKAFDPTTGKELGLLALPNPCWGMALYGDGRAMLVESAYFTELGSREQAMTRWTVGGAHELVPEMSGFEVAGVVTSIDGSMTILTNSQETTVRREDGTVVRIPIGADRAAIAPDLARLALATPGYAGSGPGAASLRIVDAATGTVLVERTVPSQIEDMSFSVDGNRLLVASVVDPEGGAKGRLQILDATTLLPVGPVASFPDPFVAAAYAPDGNSAITIDLSGRVDRWDLRPASWRQIACQIAGRSLTKAEWARYVGDEPYRETCSATVAPAR